MKSFFQILAVVVVLVGGYMFAGNLFDVVADNASAATLKEGDLIRGPDGIKVYIINDKGYKRHIFNPAVFGMYGHLRWSNIKEVGQGELDLYKTSDIYRVEGSLKIYQADAGGTKRWLNMTGAQFISAGYSFAQVFLINAQEGNYYKAGDDIVYTTNILGEVPTISDSEINLRSDAPSEDYSEILLRVWENVSFSQGELDRLVKNKDNIPMSSEEIAGRAEIIGMTPEYIESLKIWQGFNQKIADELKKHIISSKNSATHKKTIAWYQYYVNYASKLEKSASRAEIKNINSEYKSKSGAYTSSLHQEIAATGTTRAVSGLSKIRELFVNNVLAGVIFKDYGGTITTVQPCNSGVLIYIIGLDGGVFGLRYSTWAMNPYVYNIISPRYITIGRAFSYPYTCIVGVVPVGVAPYTVWFFGTSLFPNVISI